MRWISSLFARRRIFADLSDEIQQHLEEQTEALMAAGLSRNEAMREARRRFGNVTRIEERGRVVWLWPELEQAIMDVRFAVRRLRRSPGFTLTAIVTLALGIGANVFMLSLLNSLILKPGSEFASQGIVQVSHRVWAVTPTHTATSRTFETKMARFAGCSPTGPCAPV